MTNSKQTNAPRTWSEAMAMGKTWSKHNVAPALSGVFNMNDNNTKGFTVGQSAKINLPDSDWDVHVQDFMVDDLKNYHNPHLQSLLVDVREIIPDKLYDQVFVAGGFASYLAGVTNTHTDVDLFCVTAESFLELYDLICQGMPDFTIRALPVDNPSAFYHKVLKFTYQNINYDLIDSSDHFSHNELFIPKKGYSPAPQRADSGTVLCHLLIMFDLNWAMAGINLENDTIVCHPCALFTRPMMNAKYSNCINKTNISRVKKYAERLVREVDVKATQKVLTALGFMPVIPNFDIS